MNVNEACNELGSKRYYKILVSIEVTLYLPFERFFCNSTMKIIFVFYFLFLNDILVFTFYFHKYSHIFELIKCD